MRSCGAQVGFQLAKALQHKSLLPFSVKKVIVAKVKLCASADGDHTLGLHIRAVSVSITPAVKKCKAFFQKYMQEIPAGFLILICD